MQRDITLTITVESGWLDDLRAVVGHNLMLQKWHDSGRPGGEPGPTTLLKLTDAEEASIDPIVTATLQVAAEVGIAQATAALVAAPDTLFDDDGVLDISCLDRPHRFSALDQDDRDEPDAIDF